VRNLAADADGNGKSAFAPELPALAKRPQFGKPADLAGTRLWAAKYLSKLGVRL
jgi:hypothetical protein